MIVVTGSLKRRMAAWLLVTVIGLGALLMIEAWVSSRQAADRAFDAQLEAAALSISEAVQWQGGRPEVVIPVSALQILATSSQERVFYAVLDSQERRLSSNWEVTIPQALRDSVREAPLEAELNTAYGELRVYGREVSAPGWVSQEPVQVWVGHTLGGRQALALTLFRQAVSRFLVMVLLAGILMALTIRVALIPLRRLRYQLRLREADDMRPLDAEVPKEMHELVQTLDQLFTRQREGREVLLRFTADASHQLKTPLAGLQAISELALRSPDPEQWRAALEEVHGSAERTSRLAGQLLSLARLRHLDDAPQRQRVELRDLVKGVALEWAERDEANGHDLGLDTLPAQALWVEAEAWALRELIGNVIDNALRYTPAGSSITLGLHREENEGCLTIHDDGPGVPEDQLERLCRPFERLGRQGTEGSGLGMAIVDSIARRLGGHLKVANLSPSGLIVELRLRLAEEVTS